MTGMMRKRLFISMLALVSAAVAAHAQGSKTVVLAKRGDVIANSLPKATNYFVKEIDIGQRARGKIKAQGNFSPQAPKLKFFYGKNAGGSLVGTVLFVKMATAHGPFEVGVAFTPAGAISNVVVTKATEETEPWVKAAENAGVMKGLIGISSDSEPNPLQNVSESSIGAMPYFAAQVIATAVIRAVVYYRILFLPQLP